MKFNKLRKSAVALVVGATLAASSTASALTISNGEITFEMESWEDFIPGYGTDSANAPGNMAGTFNDGIEDLRGVINITTITQPTTGDSFEGIAGSLMKLNPGESLTGVLYGFDNNYLTGNPTTPGAGKEDFGYTGGFLDLYLDASADEDVSTGPAGFLGAPTNGYTTVSDGDAQLYLRLQFVVGNDTLGFLGPNTMSTLYGAIEAKVAAASTMLDPLIYLQGSSSGFLDVVTDVGLAWERFDTDSIPVGPTSDTVAKTVDFSFSNNFGTECLDANLAHRDLCGNPQFPQIGYDGIGLVEDTGLWNTQDQGPAVSSVVPEPASLALLGLGLLGFGAARKRRSA